MVQERCLLPVSEKNYAEEMLKKAEPYLAQHGGQGFFSSFDGEKIAYEKYLCENASAAVIIVHGFTESAEKFREMSYSFSLAGYNVFAIDNRGHGSSYRNVSEREVVHINRFDDYVSDLEVFIDTVVKPQSPNLPLYLYCHSMGGAVGVQFLQKNPGVFSKAVLSAPMICPKTMGVPLFVAAAVTRLFIMFGMDKKQVFLYKGFNPERTYLQSHDTSKSRFDYYHEKRCRQTRLQTAAPSYRWVNESVKVVRKNLDPSRCQKIDCPVLLCQPEEDSSVVSEKEDAFIRLVKNGSLRRFSGSRHEIYMSEDDTLSEYLSAIFEFFCA